MIKDSEKQHAEGHDAPAIRVATWNVNEGRLLEDGEEPSPERLGEIANYIGEILQAHKVDVVALQESVWFPNGEDLATAVGRESELHYTATHRLSPSYGVRDSYSGIAILSRQPLRSPQPMILPNPELVAEQPDGSIWKTFDKGMLVTRVAWQGSEFCFGAIHMYPYHEFRRTAGDSEFAEAHLALGKSIAQFYHPSLVVAGDFNTNKLGEVFRAVPSEYKWQQTIKAPTRPKGDWHDEIIITPDWVCRATTVVPNRSDHHLCIAELVLKRTPHSN